MNALSNLNYQFKKFYAEGNYVEALKKIRRLVEENPDDHWYWTRLSSVFYELRRYDDALQASEIAMSIDKRCPLVLWDYAGVLRMVDRELEAIKIYEGLLTRGEKSLAYGECGEGIKWARSLLNDCRFCLGRLFFEKKEYKKASDYLKKHLKNRCRGQYSCSSKKDAEIFLKKIKKRGQSA